MRAFLAVFIVASMTGVTDIANAEIGVDPKPWSPVVYIHAQRKTPPAGSLHISRPPSTPSRTVLKTKCFFDLSRPNFRCALRTFSKPKPGTAALTEGEILRAVREIGLPSLRVRIQPGERTLVNVETIFYTRPEQFRRRIDLLGFAIDLVAEPVRYDWHHGDGTTAATNKPGRPYPAMDVTYRYLEPADEVAPSVDVTYQVRYRIDGGPWATLGQTLQAPGPAASIEVKEAAPVLTTP